MTARTDTLRIRRNFQLFFIDHIIGNNTKQDSVAVSCNFDARVVCIHEAFNFSCMETILASKVQQTATESCLVLVNRCKFPLLESVCVVSDNVACFQHKHFTVMESSICSNDIRLAGLLHSETQCGKRLVDAHFALTTGHVNAY